MRSETQETIVVDLGSCHVKVGYGGEKAPRLVYPSAYGLPKQTRIMVGCEKISFAKGVKL